MRKLVLTAALGTASCVSAFPLYSLRFSAYQSDGGPLWAETLKMLDAYPGTIDEVWFSSGTCLPPLAWHRAQASRQAAAAVELRRRGIAPSLQLHATIGHSDDISTGGSSGGDCSAKDWRGWTGPTGQENLYCSCPRDPKFISYFVEVAKIYASYRPPSVWFDDDLRIEGHRPASPWGLERDRRGCWCERCLHDFSKAEGKSYERTSLQAAMANEPALVDRWERFQFGSLAEFAGKVVATFHAESPETMFGYQHNSYPNDCQSIVYKAIREASGGNALGCRPGGGGYFDHSPYDQLEKAYYAAREFANIGMPEIELVCPEIESCPRTFSCRTGQGVLLEALESLAMGMNSISLFIMNCKEETPLFFTRRFMKPLAENRTFFADYIAYNIGALPAGLRPKDGNLPNGMQLSCGIPLVSGYARDCGVLDMSGVDATAISSPKLLALYARADEASGGTLPALPLEPVQGWLLPRVLENGVLRSVTFVNTTIDRSEPFSVRLRGVPGAVSNATWRALGGERRNLDVLHDEKGARVEIPAVGPWNGGWLAL